MGRKPKREYRDDEMIGLPPVYLIGADYKLLVDTIKATENRATGKPFRIGAYCETVMLKHIADIRAGKKIKL